MLTATSRARSVMPSAGPRQVAQAATGATLGRSAWGSGEINVKKSSTHGRFIPQNNRPSPKTLSWDNADEIVSAMAHPADTPPTKHLAGHQQQQSSSQLKIKKSYVPGGIQ
ncbi:hypothetical protein K5F93_27185 [Pseudomonas protegens]|uniref:hypothetical protein n=1 Tax=Pseudomonas protegens TaxID=380021 RepID=UPI001C8E8068|nr:hypothetical protein [Pseudomonas protegens]QZI73836.1 hypothetical protein K5F93_27185 [Pseudomonas protegens]